MHDEKKKRKEEKHEDELNAKEKGRSWEISEIGDKRVVLKC